jgi:hypothetical protein
MSISIDTKACPFKLEPCFVQIIEQKINEHEAASVKGGVLSFRNPDYSPEEGGFHPVEISVTSDGVIQYVTDFAYAGLPSMAELVKSLDFDFSIGRFQQMGWEYPLEEGRELFTLYQRNFCAYFSAGVFEVVVSAP